MIFDTSSDTTVVRKKTRLEIFEERFQKILNSDKFNDLPQVYQKGLHENYKYSKDKITFEEELNDFSFERKAQAASRVLRETIQNNLFNNSENFFFYYMFSGMGVFPSKKMHDEYGTAAVLYSSKYNNRYMIYNPDFILYVYRVSGNKGVSFVIIHEMAHIVLGHLDHRNSSINMNNILENTNVLKNIAQDLAINSMLATGNELLVAINHGIFPGKFPYHDFPTGLSSDQYLAILRQKENNYLNLYSFHYENSGAAGHDDDEMNYTDEIDTYESSSEISRTNRSHSSRNKTNQQIYDYNKINDAAASSRGCGGASATLVNLFIKNIKTNLNPEDIFKFFLQQADCIEGKESSSRKVNKKNPYVYPGKKYVRYANIAFYCDMSGSVGDDLLGKFFDIVSECCDNGREFAFIPFTTEIDYEGIVTISVGETPTVRTVTGGTDFSCINAHAIENGFTGIVVLTDMEAPYPGALQIPRLWVTDNQSVSDFEGESVLSFS